MWNAKLVFGGTYTLFMDGKNPLTFTSEKTVVVSDEVKAVLDEQAYDELTVAGQDEPIRRMKFTFTEVIAARAKTKDVKEQDEIEDGGVPAVDAAPRGQSRLRRRA